MFPLQKAVTEIGGLKKYCWGGIEDRNRKKLKMGAREGEREGGS